MQHPGLRRFSFVSLRNRNRETFAPGLDVETVPNFVALTSINNIPIEGGWHQLRKAIGETLYSHVIKGKTDGLFNPNSDIHINLFNWIWPPVVQAELDKFRDDWNMRQIRKQANSSFPSGGTPTLFFPAPDNYNGQSAYIKVPKDTVMKLFDGSMTGFRMKLTLYGMGWDGRKLLWYRPGTSEMVNTFWIFATSMHNILVKRESKQKQQPVSTFDGNFNV
ncbi:hypothetical protein BC629DRAFT_1440149 [Irpex lacteus]|nr:hypothetical protein BC629DRAFT_1440149 [Irpex lacteus]